MIRANYFPELFESQRLDPFVREIKQPNDKASIEKLEERLQRQQQLQSHLDRLQLEASVDERHKRYTKTNYGFDSQISPAGIITDPQPLRTNYELTEAWQDKIRVIDKVNHRSMAVATYAIEQAVEDPNAFQTKRLESARDREQQRLHFDKEQQEAADQQKSSVKQHQEQQLQTHSMMLQQLQAGLLYHKVLNEPQSIEDRQAPPKHDNSQVRKITKSPKVS